MHFHAASYSIAKQHTGCIHSWLWHYIAPLPETFGFDLALIQPNYSLLGESQEKVGARVLVKAEGFRT